MVKEEENVDEYIDALVNSILERDIVQRFRIRYVEAFKSLAQHLMNNAPCEIVYKTLQEQFQFKTDHTVENYVGYLQQAYMLMRVHKYSTKSYTRVRNTKCYTVDVALLNARKDAFSGENLGWRLETLAYIELKRRYGIGYDVYYYADRSYETDFVVCHRNTAVMVVQVSYDISHPKTRTRELNGLVRGAKAVGCTELLLLTAYHEEEVQINGYTVHIVPCYKWMNNQ